MQDVVPIPPAQLRQLSHPSNIRGCVDLVGAWAVILAALYLAGRSGVWYGYGLAALVISSRQQALINLTHDAWHKLSFAPTRLNDTLGSWLYAYPVGIPFFHDRRRHLLHHRLIGHRDDPDWVNYANEGRPSAAAVVQFLLGRLCGSFLVETACSLALRRRPRIAVGAEAAGPAQPSAVGEYLRIGLCQAAMFGVAACLAPWWAYLALWALPLATLTIFCSTYRAFVEHCAGTDADGPERRLRDFAAGPVERLLIAPCHFYYHALHHAFPSVPHYHLPRARQALSRANRGYPFPVAPGYWRCLLDHLRRKEKDACRMTPVPR